MPDAPRQPGRRGGDDERRRPRSGEPRGPQHAGRAGPSRSKPPLRVFTTTLWEYPSQHYVSDNSPGTQGDPNYRGATPSWVIWQLLSRYTREKDLVVDPMCGSGTTVAVSRDLGRKALGYDLASTAEGVFRADARQLPLENAVADFVFVDPPYSTHVDYSDDPRCIGKLDAGGDDGGAAYYAAMDQVIGEIHRVMKNNRYMALYCSDSWRKRRGGDNAPDALSTKGGTFMPIGFELFALLRKRFKPVDIISVVRHNEKLARGNWHKTAEEQNFFLRGFNYLFIMKKEE